MNSFLVTTETRNSRHRIGRFAENGYVVAATSLALEICRVAAVGCDVNFPMCVGIKVSTGQCHAAPTGSIL
jgi:hypothetical protein